MIQQTKRKLREDIDRSICLCQGCKKTAHKMCVNIWVSVRLFGSRWRKTMAAAAAADNSNRLRLQRATIPPPTLGVESRGASIPPRNRAVRSETKRRGEWVRVSGSLGGCGEGLDHGVVLPCDVVQAPQLPLLLELPLLRMGRANPLASIQLL